MTLEQLAEAVNHWCESHRIAPANGQAATETSERTIRYYRTLGLVDAPDSGDEPYSEKHRLQLVGIRLLQAQGLPLRRVREMLYGRSLDQLKEMERRALKEIRARASAIPLPNASNELWRVNNLNDDFLLVSRSGQTLTAEQRQAILAVLQN